MEICSLEAKRTYVVVVGHVVISVSVVLISRSKRLCEAKSNQKRDNKYLCCDGTLEYIVAWCRGRIGTAGERNHNLILRWLLRRDITEPRTVSVSSSVCPMTFPLSFASICFHY